MIKEIAGLVKTLIEALNIYNKISSESAKKKDNLELLKIYFILSDVHEDGSRLLETTSPSLAEFVTIASKEALEMRIRTWDAILRRQGTRLQEIQSFLNDRSELSIINPRAQKRIAVIVGSKRGRVFSLFNLGAGLFFRTVLPIKESPEDLENLATKTLSLQDNALLDFNTIKLELNELKEALNEFRELIFLFMSNEDVRLLSEKARKETRIPH